MLGKMHEEPPQTQGTPILIQSSTSHTKHFLYVLLTVD